MPRYNTSYDQIALIALTALTALTFGKITLIDLRHLNNSRHFLSEIPKNSNQTINNQDVRRSGSYVAVCAT